MVFVICCTLTCWRWNSFVHETRFEDCDRSNFQVDLSSISSKYLLELLSLHDKLPSLRLSGERRKIALDRALHVYSA